MDVEVVGVEIIDEGEGDVDEARKSRMGVAQDLKNPKDIENSHEKH